MTYERRYNCILSDVSVYNKTSAINATPGFQINIRSATASRYKKDLPLKSIVYHILDGRICNFGLVEEKELFMIDIDNTGIIKYSYTEILNFLKELDLEPVCIMTTLSSTISNPRYRFLFRISRIIPSTKEYDFLIRGLADIINIHFPNAADIACCKASSIFYPCKEIAHYNTNACVDYDNLRSMILYFVKPIYLDFEKFSAAVLYKSNLITKKRLENLLSKSAKKVQILPQKIIKNRGSKNHPALQYIHCISLDIKTVDKIFCYNSSVMGLHHTDDFFNHDKPETQVREPVLRKISSFKFSTKIAPIGILLNRKENVFFEDIFNFFDKDGNILRAIILTNNSGYSYYVLYKNNSSVPIAKLSVFDIVSILSNVHNYSKLKEIVNEACNFKELKQDLDNTKKNLLKGLSNSEKYFNQPNLKKINDRNNGFLKLVYDTYLKEAINGLDKRKIFSVNNFYMNQFYIKSKMLAKSIGTKRIADIKFALKVLISIGLLETVDKKSYRYTYKRYYEYHKKRNSNFNMIVVSIPFYNKEKIRTINSKAKNLLENNYRLYNRDSISLTDKKEYEILLKNVKNIFALEKCVFKKTLRNLLFEMNPKLSKSSIKRRLNKYILMILKDFNMKEIPVNKSNMGKYGLKKICNRYGVTLKDKTTALIKKVS